MALLRQDQRQLISQRIDPKLIMANAILQQTAMELTQNVETELLENPALDLIEDPQTCQGDCVDPKSCPYCSQRATVRQASLAARETFDSEREFLPETLFDGDEDFDPVGNLEAELTLQDHLSALVRTALSQQDVGLADYIVSSLDDNGWLATPVEDIAAETGAPLDDVLRVLGVVQTLDPPGIGARDLRECLLIQLQFLRDDGRGNPLAERVVRHCFHELVTRRYGRVARTLGVSVEKVRQAVEFVKTHLSPYPASQFRPPWVYKPSSSRSTVRPDVIVRRDEFGYDVEIVGTDPAALAVNQSYREAYERLKSGEANLPEEEKKHIAEYVDRAELFIKNLGQRRKTLLAITKAIIECQQGYLETGSRAYIRPLTRTRIAEVLELHESTVSRATSNKYIQLPNQEVVPFDIFFNPSLSIKTAIEEIISGEDPHRPYSDQQIAAILQERGMTVARRTVVKYREAQKLLSSARRRR